MCVCAHPARGLSIPNSLQMSGVMRSGMKIKEQILNRSEGADRRRAEEEVREATRPLREGQKRANSICSL